MPQRFQRTNQSVKSGQLQSRSPSVNSYNTNDAISTTTASTATITANNSTVNQYKPLKNDQNIISMNTHGVSINQITSTSSRVNDITLINNLSSSATPSSTMNYQTSKTKTNTNSKVYPITSATPTMATTTTQPNTNSSSNTSKIPGSSHYTTGAVYTINTTYNPQAKSYTNPTELPQQKSDIEEYAYMVNNDDFPSLTDSTNTKTRLINNEKNTVPTKSDQINGVVSHTAETSPNYYMIHHHPTQQDSTVVPENDIKCYYSMPIENLSENTTNKVTEQSVITNGILPFKDPTNFFNKLKTHKSDLKQYNNAISDIFPLINQVKKFYPCSKYSVGSLIETPKLFLHPDCKENLEICTTPDILTYVVLEINKSHFMANFRVRKHLEEYFVPLDYLTLAALHESNPFSCDKYSDEILLFLYYSHVGDGLQMLSAYHLHRRGWRFHLKTSHWITLTTDQFNTYNSMNNSTKQPTSTTMVTDNFWFFNIFKWKMEKIETTLDFKQFESVEVYAQYLHEATNLQRNDDQNIKNFTPTTSSNNNLMQNNNSSKCNNNHFSSKFTSYVKSQQESNFVEA